MIDKNTNNQNDNALNEHRIAKKVAADPSKSGDAILLSGYIGKSSSAEVIRLYINLNFNEYFEIPRNDILHAEEVSDKVIPFGGTYLWVDKDARVSHVGISSTKDRAKFLSGSVSNAFIPPGQPANIANVMRIPRETVPLTGCPTPPPRPTTVRAGCNPPPPRPTTIATGCPTNSNIICPSTPMTGCFPSVGCPPQPTTVKAGCPQPTVGLKCPPRPTRPATGCPKPTSPDDGCVSIVEMCLADYEDLDYDGY